jgi:hypothetical protein
MGHKLQRDKQRRNIGIGSEMLSYVGKIIKCAVHVSTENKATIEKLLTAGA